MRYAYLRSEERASEMIVRMMFSKGRGMRAEVKEQCGGGENWP
jgi:hypothetical protein